MFCAVLNAVDRGDIAELKKCLAACPEIINKSCGGGSTLLHQASQEGQCEMVEELIKLGACVDVKDQCGCTPLHKACAKDKCNVARILIRNNASLTEADKKGYLPIHHCAQTGSRGLLDALIRRQGLADIESRTPDGLHPIHIACQAGNLEIVKELLEKGANPSVEDTFKYQPIHFAAQFGHFEIARCLLCAGASGNAKDEYGKTPTELAYKNGHHDLVTLFRKPPRVPQENTDVGLPTGELETHCKSRDDVKTDVKTFQESLRSACRTGSTEEVESLLERGWEGFELSEAVGYSMSLHEAGASGLDDIVTLLLNHTLDTNLTDSEGRTPLHLASEHGHDITVTKLLDHGFDIEAADKDGFRPLHCACQNGHESVVKTLIQHNAAVDSRDSFGCTPQKVAEMKKQEHILKLLRNEEQKPGVPGGREKKKLRKQNSEPARLRPLPGEEMINAGANRVQSSMSWSEAGTNTWHRRLTKMPRGQLISIIWDDVLNKKHSNGNGPEEQNYQKLLRIHYQTLVDKMDLTEVINCLFVNNVLGMRQMEEIRSERNSYEKNEKLIRIVYERPKKDFDIFVTALENTNQQHLANLLLSED